MLFRSVYFLGSKGFCTYACPYGGFFSLADRFSPGKIRVTDACNQCGHCTATCTSNVLVHAEVKQYGMVIDPGCMKCMDCISVCPNDALYFGFGKPSIVTRKIPSSPPVRGGVAAVSADGVVGGAGVSSADTPAALVSAVGGERTITKNYSLTWPEEIAGAAVFLASFLAVWDVYQIVPMLMALGIAAITTFLALRTSKLFRASDLSFFGYLLKSSGKIQRAGWLFLCFALSWIGLNAHSGWVLYHEREGSLAFQNLQIPDELALARVNPKAWLSASDRDNIADGKKHLYAAFDGGFIVNTTTLPQLAWFEYLSGNAEQAAKLLGLAEKHQDGQAAALTLYYRGAILNRLAHYNDALTSLDRSLAEAPDLILAREERGESLWQLGRRQEAVQAWADALRKNPDLVLANYMLAGASLSAGNPEQAAAYEDRADQNSPADPYFQYMIGLRLENVGMNALAEKHFQQAIALDPQFRARRNLDLLNRF